MSDNQKYLRVECGKIQFGEDWPGIFLRGDSAMYYGMLLQQLLDQCQDREDIFLSMSLQGLANTLSGADVRQSLPVQKMKNAWDAFEDPELEKETRAKRRAEIDARIAAEKAALESGEE